MSRLPETPSEIFEAYTKDWLDIYRNDLVSIVLFGSCARGEYVPGLSDINFLIILQQSGLARLRDAIPVTQKWQKRGVAVPLVLTENYIDESLDSFPVEFLVMKINHELVYGKDVLSRIDFDKHDIRLQLEREFKGKVLHLRKGLLAAGHDRKVTKALIRESLKSYLPLFEALLFVKDMAIPKSTADVFQTAAKTVDIEPEFFTKLRSAALEQSKLYPQELLQYLEKYIEVVQHFAGFVEKL